MNFRVNQGKRNNSKLFISYKSKIKENFTNRFGPYALKEMEIASIGKRPNK